MEEENRERHKKTLFVTYNSVEGIPVGLYEDDKVIALSGNYGRNGFKSLVSMAVSLSEERSIISKGKEASSRVMDDLNTKVDKLLDKVARAYIYCGASSLETVRDIIGRMKERGIEASLLGCDCDYSEKINVANELGVELIMSGCGGERTLGSIAKGCK